MEDNTTTFIYIFIVIIVVYYITTRYIWCEQENFDPSLVPVSSIVTLAKVAQKLVDGNGTLTNPGNFQVLGSVITNGVYQLNDRQAPTNQKYIALHNDNNVLGIFFGNNSTTPPSGNDAFQFQSDGGLYLGNKSASTGGYLYADGIDGQLSIRTTGNTLGILRTDTVVASNNVNGSAITVNGNVKTNVIKTYDTNGVLNISNLNGVAQVTMNTNTGDIKANGNIITNSYISAINIPAAYLIINSGHFPIFTSYSNTTITFNSWVVTNILVCPGYYVVTSPGGYGFDNRTGTTMKYSSVPTAASPINSWTLYSASSGTNTI